MNNLVRITKDNDGVEQDKKDWHISTCGSGGKMVLCSGEFFGYGESRSTYETKKVLRGGITCKNCLDIVKEFKKIKL